MIAKVSMESKGINKQKRQYLTITRKKDSYEVDCDPDTRGKLEGDGYLKHNKLTAKGKRWLMQNSKAFIEKLFGDFDDFCDFHATLKIPSSSLVEWLGM